MVKYYIMSGDLRWILEAETPEFAVLEAFAHVDGHTLGDAFYVDERGFRTDNARWQFDLWETIAAFTEEVNYEKTQTD
jgi:hypothetical protein